VLLSAYDPTDSSNASEVLDIARRRIWPVFVIEQVSSGDNAVGGTGSMACPQALNLTGAAGTSTSSAASGSASGSSGAERLRVTEGVLMVGVVMLALVFME
jgi:hypothetical protein